MLQVALGWIVCVNSWTLFRFWDDKRRAVAGLRRTPEADLLWLAMLGGSPGALLARQLFRHKTRKQPFSTYLILIVAAQIGIAVGLLVPGRA